MKNKNKTVVKKENPAKKAIVTARKIVEQWGTIQAAGEKVTRDMCGVDDWGPSLGDHRDGDNKVIDLLAKLIDKHMK